MPASLIYQPLSADRPYSLRRPLPQIPISTGLKNGRTEFMIRRLMRWALTIIMCAIMRNGGKGPIGGENSRRRGWQAKRVSFPSAGRCQMDHQDWRQAAIKKPTPTLATSPISALIGPLDQADLCCGDKPTTMPESASSGPTLPVRRG